MNPLTNVKNQQKLNERELSLGLSGTSVSWHRQYKDSAWIFVGGLSYDVTEGDVICVFSQYGEIVNINFVRDRQSGKSKGYCFICYEDQRSTILAVDNFNGTKLLGRTLRVDHVANYKTPKEHGDEDEITRKIREEGCAPKSSTDLSSIDVPKKKIKKEKKEKKHKKSKEKDSNKAGPSEQSSVKPVAKSDNITKTVKVKSERDTYSDQMKRTKYS